MEATCNYCNHWHPEQEKPVPAQDFGLCDELTGQHGLSPEYVLPLVHETNENNTPKHFEMMTGAMFGCNHFTQRKGWI